MKLTKKKAKAISLEMWRYLRDHPEIEHKQDLPKKIYSKIMYMKNKCPLCELFFCSRECPLYKCTNNNAYYDMWYYANSNLKRRNATARLVKQLEGWKV